MVDTDLVLTVSERLVDRVAHWLPLARWPVPLPIENYVLQLLWHPRVEADAEQVWFRDLLVRAARRLPELPPRPTE